MQYAHTRVNTHGEEKRSIPLGRKILQCGSIYIVKMFVGSYVSSDFPLFSGYGGGWGVKLGLCMSGSSKTNVLESSRFWMPRN